MYIGDKYPLCTNIPKREFLHIGDKYRLLGGLSAPILHEDSYQWDEDDRVKMMTLDPFSNYLLREHPCHTVDRVCNYHPIVYLTSNIDYHNTECLVETVRLIQVAHRLFYEYTRRPCVQIYFYENAKKIFSGNRQYAICANPKIDVAQPECCGLSWDTESLNHRYEYAGDMLKYYTNEYCCKFMGPGTTWKQASIREPSIFDTSSWVYYKFGYEWLKTEENTFIKESWGSIPYCIYNSNFIWTPSP